MPNVEHVTTGKPKIGGHVWRAPTGTTLPTDATTALNSAFIDMGYIAEDGLTNASKIENTEIKAWGGTVVMNSMKSRTENLKGKFISAMNPEVQKMVHGDENVTGTVDGTNGMTVTSNAKDLEEYSYVVDMIARGNVAHRVVIPSAKPIEIADIVYKDDEALGYDVTLGCTADASGNAKYEYWKAQA